MGELGTATRVMKFGLPSAIALGTAPPLDRAAVHVADRATRRRIVDRLLTKAERRRVDAPVFSARL